MSTGLLVSVLCMYSYVFLLLILFPFEPTLSFPYFSSSPLLFFFPLNLRCSFPSIPCHPPLACCSSLPVSFLYPLSHDCASPPRRLDSREVASFTWSTCHLRLPRDHQRFSNARMEYKSRDERIPTTTTVARRRRPRENIRKKKRERKRQR